MNAIETADMFANFRHLCHIHQMFLNAMALMGEALTDRERQIVLLHCGLGPTKSVVSFSRLALLFSLKSSVKAKKAYQKAVIKIRLAIPGSVFELWVVSYDQAYCLSQRTALKIAPQPRFQIWISMRVGVLRCVQAEVMALLTALYWYSKPFHCFCPVKS